MLAQKLHGKPGQFQPEDFSATKWNTARDTAAMANKITQFILNGFQRSSLTKEMYRHLSCMFGHIAEYDIHGFYTTWFEDDRACLRWVENVRRCGVLGLLARDPAWTWSDVERAILGWINENNIFEQIKNDSTCKLLSTTTEPQLTLFKTS